MITNQKKKEEKKYDCIINGKIYAYYNMRKQKGLFVALMFSILSK